MASGEELRQLAMRIDGLIGEFCRQAREFERQGGHLADGCPSMVAWLRHHCRLSGTAAADRLCVGRQLESLAATSEALAEGQIGYQSAAAVCHLYEQAGEQREQLDEQALLVYAREMGVAELRNLCRHARYALDPEGTERDEEFNFRRRRLHISALADGMQVIDGVLDAVGGAAVKSALEALASRGAPDERKHSQRMADALVELAHHALDSGRLPARRGVRPHLNVSTTLEGLRGLPGAAVAQLEGAPISRPALERLGCDATISRVMLAGSVVVDVGRATRAISAATRRALQQRDRHCRWPGCDRPPSWTTPHHLEFWAGAGRPGPPTWSCSATSTTAWSTRAGGRWSRPAAGCGSSLPSGG